MTEVARRCASAGQSGFRSGEADDCVGPRHREPPQDELVPMQPDEPRGLSLGVSCFLSPRLPFRELFSNTAPTAKKACPAQSRTKGVDDPRGPRTSSKRADAARDASASTWFCLYRPIGDRVRIVGPLSSDLDDVQPRHDIESSPRVGLQLVRIGGT
eukprot:scaffold247_cov274-Pinguiococcus_pyrenoidosus.AAC.9